MLRGFLFVLALVALVAAESTWTPNASHTKFEAKGTSGTYVSFKNATFSRGTTVFASVRESDLSIMRRTIDRYNAEYTITGKMPMSPDNPSLTVCEDKSLNEREMFYFSFSHMSDTAFGRAEQEIVWGRDLKSFCGLESPPPTPVVTTTSSGSMVPFFVFVILVAAGCVAYVKREEIKAYIDSRKGYNTLTQ